MASSLEHLSHRWDQQNNFLRDFWSKKSSPLIPASHHVRCNRLVVEDFVDLLLGFFSGFFVFAPLKVYVKNRVVSLLTFSYAQVWAYGKGRTGSIVKRPSEDTWL